MELDFSLKGMATLQLFEPNTIPDLFLNHASDVRKALYDAYLKNPMHANKLMKNFVFLFRRYLSSTDKIEFIPKWDNSEFYRIIYQTRGIKMDWINLLDNFLNQITENEREALEINNAIIISAPPRGTLIKKSFPSFLICHDKELFADWLKSEFTGRKGKSIALMILALEKLGKISYTNLSELTEAIRIYFGNIGSYQSINNYIIPYKTNIKRQDKQIPTDNDIQPFITKINQFSCK